MSDESETATTKAKRTPKARAAAAPAEKPKRAPKARAAARVAKPRAAVVPKFLHEPLAHQVSRKVDAGDDNGAKSDGHVPLRDQMGIPAKKPRR